MIHPIRSIQGWVGVKRLENECRQAEIRNSYMRKVDHASSTVLEYLLKEYPDNPNLNYMRCIMSMIKGDRMLAKSRYQNIKSEIDACS